MRLIFDGTEVLLPDASPDRVERAVADLARQAAYDGRVVAHTLVDGSEVGDLGTFLRGRLYSPPETVTVQTLPPEALVREAAATAQTYLPNLATAVRGWAERLVRGERPSGNSWLALLEGLEWLVSVLGGAVRHLPLDRAGREEAKRLIEELHAVVQEMAAAWDREDTVALADILEYRLADLIQECLVFLAPLAAGEDLP